MIVHWFLFVCLFIYKTFYFIPFESVLISNGDKYADKTHPFKWWRYQNVTPLSFKILNPVQCLKRCRALLGPGTSLRQLALKMYRVVKNMPLGYRKKKQHVLCWTMKYCLVFGDLSKGVRVFFFFLFDFVVVLLVLLFRQPVYRKIPRDWVSTLAVSGVLLH